MWGVKLSINKPTLIPSHPHTFSEPLCTFHSVSNAGLLAPLSSRSFDIYEDCEGAAFMLDVKKPGFIHVTTQKRDFVFLQL